MEKRRPRQPLMSVKIFGHLENVGGIHGDVAGAEGSDEIVNNHVENADVAKSSKLWEDYLQPKHYLQITFLNFLKETEFLSSAFEI